MNSEEYDWIEDPEEDPGEPDFSEITSDPVGVISEQFLTMIDRLKKEGYTHCEIMAGVTLAAADLAHEKV